MKPVHCAAVDLGASSGRVIVGRWGGRGLDLTEVHRFPNQFRSLAGHEYWDVPYLWSEVRTGLAKARAQFPRLASVGVDSWAIDYVLVDRRGRPVYPVHAYRDGRTAAASEALGRRGLKRVYALTGIPNYPYNTSLQLQETLRAHPGVARVAKRCLFISDYFNYLLSGRMMNELSIASHSQLLDVHGRRWSRAALGIFGIPPHLFSEPMASPRRLGPVTGIPGFRGVAALLVPGHDTACAFAAMPAAADGSDLYLSSGTWSLLGFEGREPLLGEAALALRVSNERMGDGGYRPLKSCLGLWLLEQTLPAFSARPRSPSDWRRLLTAARAAVKPAGLLDVTDAALFNPPSMPCGPASAGPAGRSGASSWSAADRRTGCCARRQRTRPACPWCRMRSRAPPWATSPRSWSPWASFREWTLSGASTRAIWPASPLRRADRLRDRLPAPHASIFRDGPPLQIPMPGARSRPDRRPKP
jgi:rhamnulokinase